jgi:ammonium transporter, Amt family
MTVGMEIGWTLLATLLAVLLQLGFALVASGCGRAQNVAHTFASSFLLFAVGILGFWACGFTVQTGMGLSGVFFSAGTHDGRTVAAFLYDAALAAAATVILSGAMAERWRIRSLVAVGLVVSMVLYPLFARWVWSSGWLAALGSRGFGHGFVDFAGSSVIHMVGGLVGLTGAMVIGPRARKFTRDRRPIAMPGHDMPMALTGTLLLFVGWFGLTVGPAWNTGGAHEAVVVALNTMLAGAAGMLAAAATAWWQFGAPDPTLMSNGCLAGLVAISAGCAFVDSFAAALIGAAAGTLVVGSISVVERSLHVDDPVGAVSVHGVCGFWGVIAVGLFADGTSGSGWNGVLGPVRGLFYGDASQLAAQTIGGLVCAAYACITGYALFKLVDLTIGNRVPPEVEAEGLDVAEMGTVAYPEFNLSAARFDSAGYVADQSRLAAPGRSLAVGGLLEGRT